MTARVSTFTNVKIGDYRYVFMIVGWSDWNEQLDEILNSLTEKFGELIGEHGLIVRPYESKARDTYEEVEKKEWPKELRPRIERETGPFMLIIANKDFAEFNPSKDSHWALIWFSGFTRGSEEIPNMFLELARKTRKGEDLFEYLKLVAKKNERKKLAHLFRHVDAGKLQLFGISINLQAIINDITGHRQ